jgi:hypothetical protein
VSIWRRVTGRERGRERGGERECEHAGKKVLIENEGETEIRACMAPILTI